MNDDEFRGTIMKYMEMRDVKGFKDLISDKTLGSFPTFKKKWNNPALFTIADIDYMIQRLRVRQCDRAVLKGEKDRATDSFKNITEKGAY